MRCCSLLTDGCSGISFVFGYTCSREFVPCPRLCIFCACARSASLLVRTLCALNRFLLRMMELRRGSRVIRAAVKVSMLTRWRSRLFLPIVEFSLQEMLGDRDGWLFSVPVDHQAMGLADYPYIVTSPMDLGTVHARLAAGRHYPSPAATAADIRLALDNALRYNAPGDAVWAAARRLLILFECRWAAAAPTLPPLDPPSTVISDAPHHGASAREPKAASAGGARLGAAGTLYNKVVMLLPSTGDGLVRVEGVREETGPFYVLHYAEGLHWCRVVPMRLDGAFPALTLVINLCVC